MTQKASGLWAHTAGGIGDLETTLTGDADYTPKT